MQKFSIQAWEDFIKNSGPITKENLFIILGRIQDTFGCVPREAVRDLGKKSGLPEARIYGALTSYRDFELQKEAHS